MLAPPGAQHVNGAAPAVAPKPSYHYAADAPPAALAYLRGESVWLCWDYVWKVNKATGKGKYTKPQLSATTGRMEGGSMTAPGFLGTFDQALATMRGRGLAGIGISLEHAGLTGADLDDCVTDSGTFTPLAGEVLGFAETYAEYSPSGDGVHAITTKVEKTIKRDDLGIELYHRGRYFTVTGNKVEDAPDAIGDAPRLIGYLTKVDAETPKPGRTAATKANGHAAPEHGGGDFFTNVNHDALERLDAWVQALHPTAEKQATGAWRVTSAALGRNLEEDLSYHSSGIQDFGVEEGLTPIDAVMKFGTEGDARSAAMWLCHRLGIEPAALGFRRAKTINEPVPDIGRPVPQKTNDTFVLPELHWAGEAKELEEPELIKGITPAVGAGLLSGQWGMLKTFMVLEMTSCVVSQRPFAGHRVLLAGGTLILAAEGAQSLPRRLKGLVREGRLAEDAQPIAWVDVCPTLLAKDALGHLIQIASAAKEEMARRFRAEMRMIVIDTIAAAAGWENENDAAQGQAVMNVLHQLSRHFQCCVMGVDHFGKAADTGTRGTSAKEAGADFVIALTGDRNISGKVSDTKLSVRKFRNGDTGLELPFSGRPVDLGEEDRFGDPKTTLVIDWGKKGQPKSQWPGRLGVLKKALDVTLADHGQVIMPFGHTGPRVTAVDRERLRKEFAASVIVKGDTNDEAKAKRDAFHKATKQAQGDGLLATREMNGVTVFWIVGPQMQQQPSEWDGADATA